MRVFVTGGSGFVGGRLIQTATRSGHTVVGLARSRRAEDAVTSRGGAAVRCDLNDRVALRAAMAGADLVVHAAAKLTGGPREAGEYHRVNVDGTRAVLDAAATAQVPRVVVLSTEQTLMGRRPLVRADESTPHASRPIGLYAATKRDAERSALAAGAVVVRPRMIWGDGDTTLLPVVVESARSGRLRWIGGGGHLTSTCHVDNVVDGVLAAGERGKPGEVYHLTDGEPVVFREFWSALLATQGVPAPTATAPRGLTMAAAAATELAWRLLRRPGSPPLDRMTVALLADECTIDDAKARRDLGYGSPVSHEAGLARMRAWRVPGGATGGPASVP
jgi:nucleoside-diphosphate-sugar epimerase